MAVTKYPVVWQAEATKNLAAIRKYLEENWTQKEIQQFFRKLEHIVSLLATYPKLFQETQARKNVRRCVVSSQTTLYYKFDGQRVEILFLFDTRQDPDKLEI